MPGGKPGKQNGGNVFAEAQGCIGERFRRCRHCCTNRCLSAVSGQGNQSAHGAGRNLSFGRKILSRAKRKQCRHRHAHKVCSAFQSRSKTGILSAKNSSPNSTAAATITGHEFSRSRAGGSSKA